MAERSVKRKYDNDKDEIGKARRRESYESRLSEAAEERSWREASGAVVGLLPQRRIDDGFSVSDTFVANIIPFDATKTVLYLEQQMAAANVVGFSYAIVRFGQLVVAGGEGWARAPWEKEQAGVAMTEMKRMTIASISKPITAVATMHLIANNDLTVDDPFYPLISSSFPNAGPGVDQITLRQLLTHTSGLDFNCCLVDEEDPAHVCYGCSELEELLAQGSNGANYCYRNPNFCLLRQVIEHVSGQDYNDYVQTNVLNPMTITSMTCEPDSDNPTLYYTAAYQALGYLWDGYSDTCSAYGWYASAIDLAKFLAHVRYHTVLSSSTTYQMLNEGLGWRRYYGTRGTYYGHGGDWINSLAPLPPGSLDSFTSAPLPQPSRRGFNGVIMHFPDGVDAVLLINTRGAFNDTVILRNSYEAAYE
jgi:CubicO group peptidase (beta-lactamase class C family)